MSKIIYINGNFSKADEARVSPFNRGLLYGDGFFETMRSYDGKIFALNEHYERLSATANFLKIPLPFKCDELRNILMQLLELNSLTEIDSRIRMTLMRGEGAAGLFPDESAEAELIVSADAVPGDVEKIQRAGIKLSLLDNMTIDHRSPLVSHKTVNYMPGILGLMEVRKKGGDEGLFVNNDGKVAEGITSNIFAVKNGVVMTPPLSAGILSGITRGIAIKVARMSGIAIEEKDMTIEDMLRAEELFITSSVREIVPVISFEGKTYTVGPLTKRMQAEYKSYVKHVLEKEAGGQGE
ncbi:MAG: aminotransferase class IV [Proteobacteria bacterium]|nr:aminotransferase class IV [Pseudomonadota bacterium]